MSMGHCEALGNALKIDKTIKRLLFKNCGLDDEEFSVILEACSQMEDFKSLIYHTNNFDEHCITKVAPLLRKKLPLHLDELRLINLNITGKISQELVQELRIKNQLSKLALVHVNLTDEAFDILIEVVSKSRNLKELDISWCERNYEDFIPFFEMLSGNRKLSYLNLSCNSLFDHRKGDDG